MKIMVCYDGSRESGEALELAKRHAAAFHAEKVYVVTSMVGGRDIAREVFANAERELRYAENVLAEENISCETRLLVRGLTPGEDIVEFAKEKEADEIIVGVRKKSKVEKLLMGSTAQYVILKAPCPVVAVK